MEYYKELDINEVTFTKTKALIKRAHQIAFAMGLWVQKLSTAPEWALPYLKQLRSDTIQLIPSIILGNRRGLHLYERACIEDFLRYFYFFDHKIECILLQNNPTKYQNLDFLIKWIRNYPTFSDYKESVFTHCSNLTFRYKELSRTIHGSPIDEFELSDSLTTLHKPIENSRKEGARMKSIFESIFFLLSLFHLSEYNSFLLDELVNICQNLGKRDKRILSGTE